MGMYTGCKIDVILKADIPQEVRDVLNHITFNTAEKGNWSRPLPDHQFFQNERWEISLSCQSAYFLENEKEQPDKGERFTQLPDGRWRLHASASSKMGPVGYELFTYWLQPYVDKNEYDKWVGEYRYEESEKPTKFKFLEDTVIQLTMPGTKNWEW